MASTNKTQHYNLSQYLADDKPSYLTDYNADMLAIDTAIYAAQQTANTAAEAIDVAKTNADQALTTAQQAQAIAEAANGLATTAKSTAETALTTAQQAVATAGANEYHGFRVTSNTDPNVKLSCMFNNNLITLTGQIYATAESEGKVLWQKSFGETYPANIPDFSETFEVAIMGTTDNSFKGRATIRFNWVLASKTLSIQSINGFTENVVTELFSVTYGITDIN